MARKSDTQKPEKNETLTAIQGMKTVALGLDFSPDFDAIREAYNPIEINQIRRDAGEEVLVEMLTFETLTELVDAVKKQKKVTILTKQPSVIEKFCQDNSLEVTIYEWKLGGPSFVLRTKRQSTKDKVQNDGDGFHLAFAQADLAGMTDSEFVITDEVL